ncbi:rod shape-determining protein MreD [Paludifilum halophilum]|uniref:Rod shape-determining protein MreD n=1 Tax=Paludifilum halophilum TaxID=1642702 RepID=A0A235B7I3_9BACL|nr:rod shape-determining protein MreD [Paludifilum halophilum]OYD08256.1 rod shape-determining protein MreD [Paludifilum halophilum]
MAAWILVGFLSFLFLLEGTVLQLLAPQTWGSDIVWIPQLAVSGVIIVSLLRDRRLGLIYGFCFGLLHDVVFGDAIGVYAFTTAAVGYFGGLFSRQFVSGPIVALLVTGLNQGVHLTMSYAWFRLFGVTRIGWEDALGLHIVPSILLNTLVAFPVYLGVQWIFKRFHPHSVQMFHSKIRK